MTPDEILAMFSTPEWRERLGAQVRQIWTARAATQENPKPHHLTPWQDLDEWNKEMDRIIGEQIAQTVAIEVILRYQDYLREDSWMALLDNVGPYRDPLEIMAEADSLNTDIVPRGSDIRSILDGFYDDLEELHATRRILAGLEHPNAATIPLLKPLPKVERRHRGHH